MFGKKDSTIIEIIDIINKFGYNHALIINEEKQLLGIVSDGDIRRAILRDLPLNSPVKLIMTKTPIVARENMPKSEILNLMLKKKVWLIPVVGKDNVFINFFHITHFVKDQYLDSAQKIHAPGKHLQKKILVIGGAGYIGSVMVRNLLNNGYNVIVLDKLMFGKEPIKDLLFKPNFEFIEGDFTDFNILIPSLQNVNTVIHLAAIVGDPAGKVDLELTNDINYRSVKVLARLCKYYKINKFLFFSTCSVYGHNNSFITEDSDLNPLSQYAQTKFLAEKALLTLKDQNFSPIILRTATVFGLSFRMRFDLVINLLTALAVKNRRITIFSGNQWRPFIHVKDVSNIVLKILNLPNDTLKHDIYNLGINSNNIKIKDLGDLIKNIISKTQVVIDKSSDDPRSYKVSFNRLENLIGPYKGISIKDGIKQMKDYLINHPIDFKEDQYINYKNFKYTILSE